MSRIVVVVAAIGACLAWAVRKISLCSGVPPTLVGQAGVPAQDEVWRQAERETIAYRIRSGPGPML